MTEEELNFKQEINIDKATKKVIVSIGLIVVSIITYIIPLILGNFDFGIVFEIISLVFLLVSRFYMSEYDAIRSKRYLTFSMVAIGWILIYDIILLFTSTSSMDVDVDILAVYYNFFWGEILSVLYLISLFNINQDLSKACNPIEYKDSTDWFYETQDEENKDNKEREE